MSKQVVLGLLFSSLCISAAEAQHPLVLQKLTDLNAATPAPSKQVVSSQIAKAAATLYPDKPGCAATGLTVEKIMPATAERHVFNGALRGQMRNGWTVIARHPACDSAPVRYMITQDPAGEFRTFRVNRGQSYAHESLIEDTWPLAILATESILARAGIACNEPKAAKLGITRVVDEESDLGPDVFGVRYKGSWTEIWPIAICGETLEIPIRFTADGDGGAYTDIKGDGIKRLPKS